MDTDYLVSRYEALREAADHHADAGWRSAVEHGQKSRFRIDAPVLDRFADYLFGGIGFEVTRDYFGAAVPMDGSILPRPTPTAEQRASHIAAIARSLDAVLAHFQSAGLAPEEARRLISADNVVGGVLVRVNLEGADVVLSAHTLAVSPRAPRLRAAFGSIPSSVMEIGGGHGRFVRDLMMLSPATRATYTDLPFNLLVAARYLSRVFPGDVHLVWSDDDAVSEGARINIVAPWRLGDVPYPIDLCCNFLSFQHMEARNLDYYGRALRALAVPAIYHVNRLTPFRPGEAAVGDRPFGDAYASVSREVVARADHWEQADGNARNRISVDQVEEILRLVR